MKKLGFLSFLVAIMCSCAGYYNVTPVSQITTDSKKGCFYYALPETYLKVEVNVVKKDYIKGPYAEYANQLLGIQNVISENNSTYEISSIDVSPYAEPNPNQYYRVESHNADLAVSLNNMGLINMVSTLEQPAFSSQKQEKKQVVIKKGEENEDILSLFRVHAELNTYEKVDTIIKKIKKDTTVIEELILQKTTVEKSQKEKAEEIAKYITKIKNKRFDLISGGNEVNYDAKAFNYMYMELEALENKYIKLFTGITTSSMDTYTFIVKPEATEDNSKQYTICNFSPEEGVNVSNDPANKLLMNIQNTGKTHALKQAISQNTSKSEGKKGFYYCIPEIAQISVLFNNKLLKESTLQISQLGVITHLPSGKFALKMNPETGNIESILTK